MIKRVSAIIKATMLEVVSEPLFFLLTITASAAITLSSYLHAHNFGEPSRMAREVGISTLLFFGVIYAVFASVKIFRRELETGTLQMALSRPIGRTTFFISKVAGIFVAILIFFVIIYSTTIITVIGAEVAALLPKIATCTDAMQDGCCSNKSGLFELMWEVSLAYDVSIIILPLVIGAILNRFAYFRFATTATFVSFFVSLVGLFLCTAQADHRYGEHLSSLHDGAYRILEVCGVVLLLPVMFLFVASAFAIRYKANIASSLSGVIFFLFLPFLGNYYPVQYLSNSGSLPSNYFLFSLGAILPFILLFFVVGAYFFKQQDIS